MKAVAVVPVLVASTLFVGMPSHAQQTALDGFQKGLKRYALADYDRQKLPTKPLCRCNTFVSGSPALVAGWVRQRLGLPGDPNRVYLQCEVPSFDGAGALAGVNFCNDWDPL